MGRHQDAWRAAQARHRGRPVNGFDLHGPRRGRPLQTWKTFIHNHAEGLASIDLFVVPTIAFHQLFAFLVLGHKRRQLLWFAVTRNPTAEWLARQITQAFPWDTAPKYLIRDNDRAFGAVFKARVQAMGIRDRPTSFRSPWQNGHIERLIGSTRHECTDHVIVFNEAHLRRLLSKYASYYNEVRTHLSLEKDAPCRRPIERFGDIIAQPILGGLHHRYARILTFRKGQPLARLAATAWPVPADGRRTGTRDRWIASGRSRRYGCCKSDHHTASR